MYPALMAATLHVQCIVDSNIKCTLQCWQQHYLYSALLTATLNLPCSAGSNIKSQCIVDSNSLGWSVIEFRRVCCLPLCKGREWVATWRTTARGLVPGLGDSCCVACLGVVTLTERLVTAWV